jgi:hypothetical protein
MEFSPLVLPRVGDWLHASPDIAYNSHGRDYQLGNWFVMPTRPLYLQVKGCLPCPWMTATDRLRFWRRHATGTLHA